MRSGNRRSIKIVGSAVLILLAIHTVGCTRLQVRSLPNRDVVGLDADAVVALMQRAGFPDEQILDLGTDLRNSLARQGAAQVRVGRKTEAIFAVHGPYIHVSSRQRNGFMYNTETGEIR
ncbi:hypothetical protein HQ563_13090 [bacterium]|nr:hypothetical protein [bacterium]